MKKSRLLAIEWDEGEGRLVLAVRKGRTLRIEAVEGISLPEGADLEQREAALRDKVRGALARHGARKAECLLAIGRSSIELKQLALPPAPDEELPELVRFQALREFATVGEDWPIDFLPLDRDPTQPRHVLAATINRELFDRLLRTCEELGLSVSGVVVRPCGMASLAARQFEFAPDEAYLLVDPLDKQMDLAVMQGSTIVFLRSARYEPAVGEEQLKSIVLEVRRTIAAAANRLGSRKLAGIYLCGRGPVHLAWAERLQNEFEVAVQTFDPFTGVEVAAEVEDTAEDQRSRYAPLIGMLLDAVEEKRQSLDFLNPRERPATANRRRQWLIAASAAAACVLLAVGWVWYQLASLDGEIAQLETDSAGMEGLIKRSEEVEKKVETIDKWAAADIDWLAELARLSKQLPPAKEVMLTQLRASTRVAGGEMQLDGLVASAATIDQMEKNLRDAQHAIEQKAGQQSDKDARYRWAFKSAVLVEPPAEDEAPSPPLEAAPAGSSVASAKTGGE